MNYNLAEKMIEAGKTSFIDSSIDSEDGLRTKLLYNDTKKGNTVLANLEKELNDCESFWMSVAFITRSGLIALKETFKELEKKGIQGRILTTDYLDFNDPKALKDLLKYSNVEVHVYEKEYFHTKGYMIQKKDIRTFIIGSSNLTQNALKRNKEWNLRVSSLEDGELIQETEKEFQVMWKEAIPLSLEWIENYSIRFEEQKKVRRSDKIARIRTYTLEPNIMQIEAIRSLDRLRKSGEKKALLISATGTGKTYLSAFDVRNVKPKRMLFLVHREQILKQAIESYKDVLGDEIKTGLLTGKQKDVNANYLFSTVQTMSKNETMEQFKPDEFDYICIDETHRSGAETYQRIINYFNPTFLLGMTASPERMDGYDIYSDFDHNIAYEIRLQEAMDMDLLCPFHYFGVSEVIINGSEIEDENGFQYLVTNERVDNIIDKAEYYGYSGSRVKGLIFCATKEAARELSLELNNRNYRTIALTGEDSQEKREEAIEKLEKDEYAEGLDYILTVDIFNEGIDIPQVNQIIMLRPTQSAIIFVQQLGRGLRKAHNKECVVIIDFIGNYKNNFLIPIALSGDRTFNKDSIRKYIVEGNRTIPGCSTIHFDEVSRKRIFDSINNAGFKKLKILKEEYINIKNKIGRIPLLMDFYNLGAIDPELIIGYSKNYYAFLNKVDKEYVYKLSTNEEKMLEFISVYLANGKRPHELLILKMLFEKGTLTKKEISEQLKTVYGIRNNEKAIESAIHVLNGDFLSGSDKKYQKYIFLDPLSDNNKKNEAYQRCMSYYIGLRNPEFIRLINDVIAYALKKYELRYYHKKNEENLCLYEKYSRKDVCRLLNWSHDDSSTLYGYQIKYNTCPIFVTYDKSNHISASINYKDCFINEKTFSWMTRSRRTLENEEVKKILNYQNNDLKIYLFVKKADGEGKDFYYLGEVFPKINEVKLKKIIDDKGKELPVVNIPMRLKKEVQSDIYDYLTL